jgi:hypothetical protein
MPSVPRIEKGFEESDSATFGHHPAFAGRDRRISRHFSGQMLAQPEIRKSTPSNICPEYYRFVFYM